LNPNIKGEYPDNTLINKQNIAAHTGCESILQTYTLHDQNQIAACCGIGMKLIPELSISFKKSKNYLKNAIINSEKDYFKLWLHSSGPEKILAWAAEKNSNIKWENIYAHRCQTCLRIYKDQIVRDTIRKYYKEELPNVVLRSWIVKYYLPTTFLKIVSDKNT
jgi:hypothetical protein